MSDELITRRSGGSRWTEDLVERLWCAESRDEIRRTLDKRFPVGEPDDERLLLDVAEALWRHAGFGTVTGEKVFAERPDFVRLRWVGDAQAAVAAVRAAGAAASEPGRAPHRETVDEHRRNQRAYGG